MNPLASETPYRIDDIDRVLTPALVIYPQIVDANIQNTIRLLGGDPNRWRPHVKTAKLEYVMQRIFEHGVKQCKCSTTLELKTACDAGAKDVLLAYAVVGVNALRVRELAKQYGGVRMSVLVENVTQAQAWAGSTLGIFVDINPGMNRTGVAQERVDEILHVARSIHGAGLEFRGLHYYDGHMTAADMEERQTLAHSGYNHVLEIVAALEQAGIHVEEVITSGTPAFPAAAAYWPFESNTFIHRVSPGTVVYMDCTSLAQFPEDAGYRPAALIVSTVVSHPAIHHITCDAGHKAVSADAGVPTCAVVGRLDLIPRKPSEEHLPIEVPAGTELPPIGETLYLVPRHVCPTVNNFDYAVLVSNNRIIEVKQVTARGHEPPLLD